MLIKFQDILFQDTNSTSQLSSFKANQVPRQSYQFHGTKFPWINNVF